MARDETPMEKANTIVLSMVERREAVLLAKGWCTLF